MNPTLAPGDLLRLTDGLEMLDGVAQFPAPLLQGLVLPGQQRHRVPSLRNIVGGEQDAGPAAHGDGVGSNAPYGGIGQAEHLLIPQRLPGTAAAEFPVLQMPLEFQPAADGLSGQLPGQPSIRRLHSRISPLGRKNSSPVCSPSTASLMDMEEIWV